MRRTDIKLLVLVALVIGLLIAIYSCSNPKDPVDSQPPTVAITNPVNNTRVLTSVDVTAEASDNTGVTKVEFYIDAQLLYTDKTPPWSCYWTMTDEHSGEHTVLAKAFDAAGNSETSDLVTVTCENLPPSVIADLEATDPDITGNLTLTWTAPGESGDVGTAVLYDIRHYWTTLTVENWNSGTQLEDVPVPQEAGSAESYDVTGLISNSKYFFAIRTQDSAGNWSGVSNSAMVITPAVLALVGTYDVGAEANPNIIVGDFNGDSFLDLVVSHRLQADNISVLFGYGDGTFQQPPVSFTLPVNPGTLCALDADNDSDLDIAVPDWDVSDVVYTSMFTWTEIVERWDPVTFMTIWTDTVVYFDETHKDDVSGMCMMRGVGDGTFTEEWEFFADTFYAHCTNTENDWGVEYILYDVDSCWCDLYDTFYYEEPYIINDSLWLECMNPDSNLCFPETPVMDWTYGNAIASCTGDFNDDNYMDAVFVHHTMSRIGVMYNDGAGVLLPPDTFNNSGILPESVCSGDFNGDGLLDLAVANSSANRAAVLRNTGGGTFGPATTHVVGAHPASIVSGDFDNDGNLDIATADYSGATVSILYNQGGGVFPSNARAYQAGWGPSGLVTVDLTGDGTLDLVVANFNDDNVTVLINEGLYRYYSDNSVYIDVGDGPGAVGCGDLDGDGDIDVAVLNQNDGTVSILINQIDHGL